MPLLCFCCEESEPTVECGGCSAGEGGAPYPLCDVCSSNIHKGHLKRSHAIAPLSYKFQKDHLQLKATAIETKRKVLEKKLEELKHTHSDIQENADQCKRILEEACYEIQRKVQDKVKQLIAVIAAKKEGKIAKISQCRKIIDEEMEGLKKTGKEVKDVMNSNNISVLYRQIPALIDKLDADIDTSPIRDHYPDVTFNVKLDISVLRSCIENLQIEEVEQESGMAREEVKALGELKEGDKVEGRVEGRMNEKGEFWLVRDFDKYPKVLEELEMLKYELRKDLIIGDIGPVKDGSIEEGYPCFALYESDGCWYRAVVDKTTSQKDIVQVRWLDYAHTSDVDPGNILPLPEKYRQLPFQAVKCCVFEDLDCDVPRDARWEFLDRTTNQPMVCTVNKKISDGVPPVWLVDIECTYQPTEIMTMLRSKLEAIQQKKDSISCRDVRLTINPTAFGSGDNSSSASMTVYRSVVNMTEMPNDTQQTDTPSDTQQTDMSSDTQQTGRASDNQQTGRASDNQQTDTPSNTQQTDRTDCKKTETGDDVVVVVNIQKDDINTTESNCSQQTQLPEKTTRNDDKTASNDDINQAEMEERKTTDATVDTNHDLLEGKIDSINTQQTENNIKAIQILQRGDKTYEDMHPEIEGLRNYIRDSEAMQPYQRSELSPNCNVLGDMGTLTHNDTESGTDTEVKEMPALGEDPVMPSEILIIKSPTEIDVSTGNQSDQISDCVIIAEEFKHETNEKGDIGMMQSASKVEEDFSNNDDVVEDSTADLDVYILEVQCEVDGKTNIRKDMENEEQFLESHLEAGTSDMISDSALGSEQDAAVTMVTDDGMIKQWTVQKITELNTGVNVKEASDSMRTTGQNSVEVSTLNTDHENGKESDVETNRGQDHIEVISVESENGDSKSDYEIITITQENTGRDGKNYNPDREEDNVDSVSHQLVEEVLSNIRSKVMADCAQHITLTSTQADEEGEKGTERVRGHGSVCVIDEHSIEITSHGEVSVVKEQSIEVVVSGAGMTHFTDSDVFSEYADGSVDNEQFADLESSKLENRKTEDRAVLAPHDNLDSSGANNELEHERRRTLEKRLADQNISSDRKKLKVLVSEEEMTAMPQSGNIIGSGECWITSPEKVESGQDLAENCTLETEDRRVSPPQSPCREQSYDPSLRQSPLKAQAPPFIPRQLNEDQGLLAEDGGMHAPHVSRPTNGNQPLPIDDPRPRCSLPVGPPYEPQSSSKVVKVYIECELSPTGTFWAQIARNETEENDYQVMLDNMKRGLNDKGKPDCVIHLYKMVAAYYEADQQWYRARVEGQTSDKVLVRYIDYGNSSWVSRDQIQDLPLACQAYPQQTIECSIQTAKEQTFSEKAQFVFRELTLDKLITAYMRILPPGLPPFFVELWEPTANIKINCEVYRIDHPHLPFKKTPGYPFIPPALRNLQIRAPNVYSGSDTRHPVYLPHLYQPMGPAVHFHGDQKQQQMNRPPAVPHHGDHQQHLIRLPAVHLLDDHQQQQPIKTQAEHRHGDLPQQQLSRLPTEHFHGDHPRQQLSRPPAGHHHGDLPWQKLSNPPADHSHDDHPQQEPGKATAEHHHGDHPQQQLSKPPAEHTHIDHPQQQIGPVTSPQRSDSAEHIVMPLHLYPYQEDGGGDIGRHHPKTYPIDKDVRLLSPPHRRSGPRQPSQMTLIAAPRPFPFFNYNHPRSTSLTAGSDVTSCRSGRLPFFYDQTDSHVRQPRWKDKKSVEVENDDSDRRSTASSPGGAPCDKSQVVPERGCHSDTASPPPDIQFSFDDDAWVEGHNPVTNSPLTPEEKDKVLPDELGTHKVTSSDSFGGSNQSLDSSTSRSHGRCCYTCGRIGHMQYECPNNTKSFERHRKSTKPGRSRHK